MRRHHIVMCARCGTDFKRRSGARNRYCSRSCAQHSRTDRPSFAARFWAKVDRDGPIPGHCPELGPCWLWTASVTAQGYGQIAAQHESPGYRMRTAHHAAIFVTTGAWPPAGAVVLHRCDTKRCVRFSHLRIGTHAENVADKVAKGRQLRGSAIVGSRLTAAQVRRIRAAITLGQTDAAIARAEGLSPSHVQGIRVGRAWAWLE